MRKLGFILVLALLANVSEARTSYRLPAGTNLVLPKGTYQGYTLEEMKILLKMDVDLEAYEKEIPRFKEMIDNYTRITKAKDEIIKSQDTMIKLANADRERLTTKWTEENKLRHVCENKPRFGSWIAWGTAGVATTVATVLAIILTVRD